MSIQGFGKVATNMSEHLMKDDAQLVVTDIYEEALDRARDLGLKVVAAEKIFDVDCDIFAPCALGGVLNGRKHSKTQLPHRGWWGQQPASEHWRMEKRFSAEEFYMLPTTLLTPAASSMQRRKSL